MMTNKENCVSYFLFVEFDFGLFKCLVTYGVAKSIGTLSISVM